MVQKIGVKLNAWQMKMSKSTGALAQFGETLIDDGDTIIHHCNTGALARLTGGRRWESFAWPLRMQKNSGVGR
jgi:methylthioribose-1-phosphate isomerase